MWFLPVGSLLVAPRSLPGRGRLHPANADPPGANHNQEDPGSRSEVSAAPQDQERPSASPRELAVLRALSVPNSPRTPRPPREPRRRGRRSARSVPGGGAAAVGDHRTLDGAEPDGDRAIA